LIEEFLVFVRSEKCLGLGWIKFSSKNPVKQGLDCMSVHHGKAKSISREESDFVAHEAMRSLWRIHIGPRSNRIGEIGINNFYVSNMSSRDGHEGK
jgi:hypothetical protein